MKNRLLAAMALCCATSMSVWAGNWDKPSVTFVEPDLTTPTGEIPTTGFFPYIQDLGSYYIYHVATEQFMTNSGTALNVGPSGQVITLGYGYDRDALKADPTYNYVGWILSMPDAPSNSEVADFHEIFADNGTGNSLWVDGNGQHMLWQFKKQDNGTYLIAAIDEDKLLGVDSENAGSAWGRAPQTAEDQTTTIIPNANKDLNPLVENEWKFVSVDDYKIYRAKFPLYEALNKAEADGMNVDAYAGVYNKVGVTVEELESTCAELKSAYTVFLSSLATPENPIDFTARGVVMNPDGTNLDGWTTEGKCAVQSNGEHWSALDAAAANPKNLYFEPCDWGATGFKASIKQTLTDMPNGLYRLTAAGRAELNTKLSLVFNEKKVDFPNVGTYGGTIALDGTEWPSIEEGVAAGKEFGRNGEGYGWNYATIELTVVDGTLVIGCESSTTMVHQWCSFDDVKLLYMGAVDLSYIKDQLRTQIESAESTRTGYDNENAYYSIAGGEAFDKDIADAKALLDNTSATEAELLAMEETVKARMDTLANDVRVYGLMEDKLAEIDDMKTNAGFEPASLMAYWEELNEAYDARTFDPAEYDGITDKARELLSADYRTALLNGDTDDVTPIIVNADFPNDNASGWNGGPALQYGIAEIYDTAPFDVYQVIEGLPAGSYEISVDGFYRPGSNADCASNYMAEGDTFNEICAFLYGNDAQAPLSHAFDYAVVSNEGVPGNMAQITTPNSIEKDQMFVPNDRQSLDYLVNVMKGDFPRTTVVCAVGEDGTLRFGVKATKKNNAMAWTPFDNFKITYLGESIDGYITPLNNALDAAKALLASDAVKARQDADDLQRLATTYELEKDSYDQVAQYTEAIDALNEKIELVQKGIDAYKDAFAMASAYSDNINLGLYEEYDATLSGALLDACDEITVGYDDPDLRLATLAEIEAAREKVLKAYSDMILSNVTGSAENPSDVTMLLRNPGFEDATGSATQDGWIVGFDGGNANLVNPEVKGTIYPFFEYYNNNTFNISQTLSYLKAGWYILDVQAYYRAGGNNEAMTARRDSSDARNVYLYATLADGSVVEKPVCSIFETIVIGENVDATPGRDASDVMIGKDYRLESDVPYMYIPNSVSGAALRFNELDMCHNQIAFEVKEDLQSVVIGLKKDEHLGSDWCAFDNFKLSYTGTEKPEIADAIGSVEASTTDIVNSVYYTIGGIRVAKPAQGGLYIRVDQLSDGTKKVTKIMVK